MSPEKIVGKFLETPKEEKEKTFRAYKFGVKIGNGLRREVAIYAKNERDCREKADLYIAELQLNNFTKIKFLGPIEPFILDVDEFIAAAEQKRATEKLNAQKTGLLVYSPIV